MTNKDTIADLIEKWYAKGKATTFFDSDRIKLINEILSDLQQLQAEQIPTQQELDDRDNDLCIIANTPKKGETRIDLYMRIIEYLVKKGFLQTGEAHLTPKTTVPNGEIDIIKKPYPTTDPYLKNQLVAHCSGCDTRIYGDNYCSGCGNKIKRID